MMNDQAKHLRHMLENNSINRSGHTIAIVSGKGGVGKSNIAVNFSLELIARNHSVLLVDLDVGMCNIDILLGLTANKTIADLINQRLLIEDIIEIGPNNIAYIAGGSGINQIFSLTKDDANYFLKEYEKIQHLYDYIIFDIGAGVSSDSMFFILASDECFVVTTPEPTSITDAYGIIKHIVKLNNETPIYLIMNRISSLKQGKQSMMRFQKVVKQFLNVQVHALGFLLYDQMVTRAVINQVPLQITHKRSLMAEGIQQMTDHYLTQRTSDNLNYTHTFIQRFKLFLSRR